MPKKTKEKVTIIDIARRAKVSPSAVSIVLNDRPGVSDETRARIREIIKETDYTPNKNSQKLILLKSFNIFVAYNSAFVSFDNMFYNSAISGMIGKCSSRNYNVVLSDIGADYFSSALHRAVNQKDVDGVVFIQNVSGDILEELKESGIPAVVIDSHRAMPCLTVSCDYAKAAYMAVSYLIDKGHTQIGFIGMESIPEFYKATRAGFSEAAADNSLTIDDRWIKSSCDDEGAVTECVKAIIGCAHRPTAIFCASDILAVYAMKGAAAAGLRVPDDMSFCAIDNIILSQYCSPALTTVDINKQKLGETAVALLFASFENKEPSSVIIPADTIIERDSVKNVSQ